MAKPKANRRPPPPPPSPGWHLAKMAAKALLALGLAFAVLVGVASLGDRAGTRVAPHPRYTVAFADIETDAPPNRDRKTFLTEVRFLGDLPETLQSVDPNLAEHLGAAFRKHPWVSEVGGVTLAPEGHIRVALLFREPALAIQIGIHKEPRAVDRGGVLLPADAPIAKLPLLLNRLVPANVSAGQKWPDPDVLRALELVGLYPCERIERRPDGWRIEKAVGPAQKIAGP